MLKASTRRILYGALALVASLAVLMLPEPA